MLSPSKKWVFDPKKHKKKTQKLRFGAHEGVLIEFFFYQIVANLFLHPSHEFENSRGISAFLRVELSLG